jgi:hypothetical protein
LVVELCVRTAFLLVIGKNWYLLSFGVARRAFTRQISLGLEHREILLESTS